MPISISEQQIKDKALALGFSSAGIARLADDPVLANRFDQFIASDGQGDMDWLAKTAERRRSPLALWPEARSAIMVTLNYGSDIDPMARLTERDRGVISLYALGRDYHDLLKGRLKLLAQWFAAKSGGAVKVFVDTAPLMEKPLAAKAGLGWQGKHTNLVSRSDGSWVFLGAILTTASLDPTRPTPTAAAVAAPASISVRPPPFPPPISWTPGAAFHI